MSEKEPQEIAPEFTLVAPERVLGEQEKVLIAINNETGQIAHIGDQRDMNEWLEGEKRRRGKIGEPEVIRGGVVFPGLTEAHTHPSFYTILEISGAINISELNNPSSLISQLRKLEEAAPEEREENEPIVCVGWNSVQLPKVSREDLDGVGTSRPVIVFDASFHKAVGNTEAMKRLEELLVKYYRPGEISGKIDRDQGVVTAGYVALMAELIAQSYPVEEIAERMETNLERLLMGGVVAVHELDPLTYTGFLAYLTARKKWQQERGYRFPITEIFINPLLLSRITRNLQHLVESGLLTEGDLGLFGVKLFADGSFGARTALVEEPYTDSGTHGRIFSRIEDLNRAMRMAREFGVEKLAIHGIGDRGIKRAIEMARRWIGFSEGAGLNPDRIRLEHFELPRPLTETLQQAKSLGLWVSMQPNFLLDYVYEDRLGERVRLICPHREILGYEIPMMFGTDGMPPSMLFAIWCATHATEEHQRLTFEEAMLAASLTAAHYERSGRGKIMEGMPADILVCDSKLIETLASGRPDVRRLPPDKIPGLVSGLEDGIRSVLIGGKKISKR